MHLNPGTQEGAQHKDLGAVYADGLEPNFHLWHRLQIPLAFFSVILVAYYNMYIMFIKLTTHK